MLYTLFLFCVMSLTEVSNLAIVFTIRYSRWTNMALALIHSWNVQFSLKVRQARMETTVSRSALNLLSRLISVPETISCLIPISKGLILEM